jgi:hypothetical protein
VHKWAAEKGKGGAHWGGGVGGGTQPRFHGGVVPSATGSGQGVEGARRALRGVQSRGENFDGEGTGGFLRGRKGRGRARRRGVPRGGARWGRAPV